MAVERLALDLVFPLRETTEEVLRRQGDFVRIVALEGRLGALEEDLGQALPTQAALNPDIEQLALIRAFDLELLPGVAIDEGVNPQVAVGVIELEEDVGDGEGHLVTGQTQRCRRNQSRRKHRR